MASGNRIAKEVQQQQHQQQQQQQQQENIHDHPIRPLPFLTPSLSSNRKLASQDKRIAFFRTSKSHDDCMLGEQLQAVYGELEARETDEEADEEDSKSHSSDALNCSTIFCEFPTERSLRAFAHAIASPEREECPSANHHHQQISARVVRFTDDIDDTDDSPSDVTATSRVHVDARVFSLASEGKVSKPIRVQRLESLEQWEFQENEENGRHDNEELSSSGLAASLSLALMTTSTSSSSFSVESSLSSLSSSSSSTPSFASTSACLGENSERDFKNLPPALPTILAQPPSPSTSSSSSSPPPSLSPSSSSSSLPSLLSLSSPTSSSTILPSSLSSSSMLIPPSSSSSSSSSPSSPMKDGDKASAHRLAKRLFYLDGFKKEDVLLHLTKQNAFSRLVCDEYMTFFDTSGLSLTSSLRSFCCHLISMNIGVHLLERLLLHLANRYHVTNPGVFQSADSCHTLACSILLLNNDLQSKSADKRSMTEQEYLDNLEGLNSGVDFNQEMLRTIYREIKSQAIVFPFGSLDLDYTKHHHYIEATGDNMAHSQRYFHENYKKGYLMRKCCLGPGGRKIRIWRRKWQLGFCYLKDLIIYLFNDNVSLTSSSSSSSSISSPPPSPSSSLSSSRLLHVESSAGSWRSDTGDKGDSVVGAASDVIHLHHSLATEALDYVKKSNVLRLKLSDGSEYLMQASNAKECYEWMDAINTAAACLSDMDSISSSSSNQSTTTSSTSPLAAATTMQAPEVSHPCGILDAGDSYYRRYRRSRSLLAFRSSSCGTADQLKKCQKVVRSLEEQISSLTFEPFKVTRSKTASERMKKIEKYLKHELTRFKTYSELLRQKLHYHQLQQLQQSQTPLTLPWLPRQQQQSPKAMDRILIIKENPDLEII